MIDTVTRPSPFRGPRSFQTGDRLYGRDREARDLLSTLIAERIVLLHSPSGAGKTSLVQAALIPMLEDREFTVLPVVRLNAAPEGPAGNRYLRSALLALEEGRPPEEQLPPAELAGLDLAGYLERRIGPDEDALLIIDQFEEVLTLDPTDIAAKHAFFDALGRALRDRRYWALIAMRDDYVAALDPYLRHMPNRLDTRFRLDLLSVEGAKQALREPPRELGVSFADDAVTRLVDDLRRVNVQLPDGRIEEQLGPHVEPVQLQVLGLRIWAGLAPDDQEITAEDVAAVGDVSQALADYYAEQVAAVSAGGVSERAVRSWFDRELITPQGVRGQVLQGQGESAGLPNGAIRALVDAYLVRAEPRRGATWFELAHDRLIAPVRASNAAWFAANLSTLQRQADLWEQQGRPNGLLLRGESLREAETWAAANGAAVTPAERDLLGLSREAEAQARRVRNLAIGATVLAIAATIAFGVALWFFNRAEEQRRLAEQNARLSQARELAAASVGSLPADPQRSLLLGLAAVEATRAVGEPVTPEAAQALQQAAQADRVIRELAGHTAGLRAVAYSPDGATLATSGADGSVRLWGAADGAEAAVLAGHADEVYALAFSPDGATLASAGAEGVVILWDLGARGERGRLAAAEGVVIYDLAFSPDGATLAAALDDGTALVWDTATGAEALALTADPDYSLNAVAFSPDGAQIALGGGDALVRVWDLAAAVAAGGDLAPALTLEGPSDSLIDLAYSPDGAQLAGVGLDPRAYLWDAADGTLLTTLQGHAGSIYGAVYSPDGALLATASSDGTAKIWRLDSGQALLALAGHRDFVYGVAFAPDGRSLATASLDATARVWDLAFAPPDGTNTVAASPDGALIATAGLGGVRLWEAATGAAVALLPAGDDGFTALAFSPDGAALAVGDGAGGIGVYPVADLRAGAEEPLLVLEGHSEAIGRLAYSPDGARLASASDDTTVRVWDTADGTELLLLEGFDDWVYGLALSPAGDRIAAGDQSGALILWDDSGAELARVDVGAAVNALAFSPDGATLAVAADDGVVYRYGADGTPRDQLTHGAQVSAVAYGSDGALLSAGADGRVRSWAADGTPGAAIPLPGAVYALAPLPGGRLAAVGADGVAHILPLALDDLLADARARLIRGPSAEECAAYRLSAGCR